jgi:hypothetical protein
VTIWRRLLKLASNFLMPNTIALCIALPCALIQPVKALFVQVDGWSESRIPFAPDDRPPLAFIIETAQFVGAITVPASLILLGASMGRLTVSPINGIELMPETGKVEAAPLCRHYRESLPAMKSSAYIQAMTVAKSEYGPWCNETR